MGGNVKYPATLTLTKHQEEVIDWLRGLTRARPIVIETSLRVSVDGKIYSPTIRIIGGVVDDEEGVTCKKCKHTHYEEAWAHVVFEWDWRGFSHAELTTGRPHRSRNRITTIREAKARLLSSVKPKHVEEGPF